MSTINNDMICEDTTNEELAKVLCDLQQGHIKPSSNLATPSTAAAELSPPSPSPAKRSIRSNPGPPPEETSTTLLFPTSSAAKQPAKTETTANASKIPSTVLVSDESSSSSPTSHNNNNSSSSSRTINLPSAAALSPSSLAAAKATAASALTTSQSAALPSFPVKLYEMMQDSVSKGFEDVVSWQTPLPGVASSFKVQNTHRFVDEIMPRYFKQTKFKSFQRQLNIYNFQRVHDGPNRGGYYHPYFVRNAPELLKLIPRKRMSLTNGGLVESRNDASAAAAVAVPSAASVPTQVDATNPLAAVLSQPLTGSTSSSPISTMLLQALAAAATPVTPSASADQQQLLALLQAASANEEERHRMLQQSLLLLSAANTAGLASTTHSPATNLLLSSGLASDQLPNAFATSYGTAANPTTPQHLSSNTNSSAANQHVFPWKLYKMLEEAPAKKFDHIVSWVQNGTAFKVHNAQGFLAEVIYQYFDQSKYESFRRQLNLYGFTRVVRGRHRGVYSHPFFRQGHQDWCRFITRQQPSQLHGGNNGSTNNQDNNAPPQPYAGSEDDDDHDESESSPPRQQAQPTDTQIVAASSSSANNPTSV
ncbi:HSF-type DNA-binding protein [Nitzschia inconspicua]|uniref:HSF-type DNA-binding protein n=1 Tax=Nitzschia inconspicua TaxID=303405 RepID=A0A9K3PY90_9STRA|nr:HSF-type DNA-binding protein [Nitzschia inconspicua]